MYFLIEINFKHQQTLEKLNSTKNYIIKYKNIK
jgi:hypothetical protein